MTETKLLRDLESSLLTVLDAQERVTHQIAESPDMMQLLVETMEAVESRHHTPDKKEVDSMTEGLKKDHQKRVNLFINTQAIFHGLTVMVQVLQEYNRERDKMIADAAAEAQRKYRP